MREHGKKVLRRCLTGPLQLGIVLLYHRVADLETDPQLLAVSPGNFAEHLEILRRDYAPIRLRDLGRRLPAFSSRARRVALTFDDGYADNLYHGLPSLQHAGIPATVFLVAGQIGQRGEFWWDELERILLGTPDLPPRLELSVGSERFSWRIDRAGDQSDRHWHVLSAQPGSPRQVAYKELCGLIRPLDVPSRDHLLDQLRSWANVDGTGCAYNRALTEEEVAALATDGLMEVGAHTMTHPVLSAQPLAVQKHEIEASKRRLEDILGAQVCRFSYPFGGLRDYTPATTRLVREAGYLSACSSSSDGVHWRTDRYQIPRLTVRDWKGDEFAQRLDAFFRS